jgi:hypothetical protein
VELGGCNSKSQRKRLVAHHFSLFSLSVLLQQFSALDFVETIDIETLLIFQAKQPFVVRVLIFYCESQQVE